MHGGAVRVRLASHARARIRELLYIRSRPPGGLRVGVRSTPAVRTPINRTVREMAPRCRILAPNSDAQKRKGPRACWLRNTRWDSILASFDSLSHLSKVHTSAKTSWLLVLPSKTLVRQTSQNGKRLMCGTKISFNLPDFEQMVPHFDDSNEVNWKSILFPSPLTPPPLDRSWPTYTDGVHASCPSCGTGACLLIFQWGRSCEFLPTLW